VIFRAGRPAALALLLCSLSTRSFAAPTEKVSFRTADGVTLNALFAKPGAGKPVVIMLHGLASTKEEWLPLIGALTKKDLGVLAYDSRPPGTPWEKLVDDVGAAVRYLEEKQGVDRKSVLLAGASLGANVCVKYNALTNVGRGVLLLSPGLNYQGLTTGDSVQKIKKTPLLFVASPADYYAYQSCLSLIRLASNGNFWSSNKPGHGVQMFDADLLNKLTLWLESQK